MQNQILVKILALAYQFNAVMFFFKLYHVMDHGENYPMAMIMTDVSVEYKKRKHKERPLGLNLSVVRSNFLIEMEDFQDYGSDLTRSGQNPMCRVAARSPFQLFIGKFGKKSKIAVRFWPIIAQLGNL